MSVSVQAEDFDPGRELQGFGRGAGAVVTFTGLVRDLAQGGLVRLEIEHYPEMTTRALGGIEAEARRRWKLDDCRIVHRFGKLAPGERIMMVATASAHRQDAFLAASFLMDYLKSRAPFWKKEITKDAEHWVKSKDTDETALKRW